MSSRSGAIFMNYANFNELFERRVSLSRNVLAKKSAEYSSDGEKLHNFKHAARARGKTPAQALDGMLMKHLCSVWDMIDGNVPITQYMIDEKIGDTINYLILLEAIFTEEVNTKAAVVALNNQFGNQDGDKIHS